jgi:hypothetical protein
MEDNSMFRAIIYWIDDILFLDPICKMLDYHRKNILQILKWPAILFLACVRYILGAAIILSIILLFGLAMSGGFGWILN